ncbi:DUF3857 domain-containing protein [Cecembia calidifontis]|nr:DUF3857 domain-containing protein [Cecembia calidifontis]
MKFLIVWFVLFFHLQGIQKSMHGTLELFPDSILEKEDKITLMEDFSVVYQSHIVLEIYNPSGLTHATTKLPEDALNKIQYFEANIIDLVSGKTIKKVKLKDLKSISYQDQISLYDDTQIKIFELEGIALPARVEISIQRSSSSNFFIEDWYPIMYYNQKVRKAKLELKYPRILGLRYKEQAINSAVSEIKASKDITLNWHLEDLSIIEFGSDEVIPVIEIAPQRFSLEGYTSNMASWEGLGAFIAQLNRQKDALPLNFADEVKQMVEGIEDEYEKVSVLYTYLQKNYRYVAISLGIGGWMPRPANEVVATKYGECKALSTLMKGMLSEVGIESQYTLVFAGDDHKPLDRDFPNNKFNHAMLRVPLKDGVIWLECTNSFLPAGFSGDFTMNRDVLVVTDKGGFLDRTPDYRQQAYNSIETIYEIELLGNGDARLKGLSKFSGFPSIGYLHLEKHGGEKQRRDYLNRELGGTGILIQNYSIEKVTIKEIPVTLINFDGMIQRFGQQTAKRIILPSHWKKLDPSMITNGVLNWKEEYIIRSERAVEMESNESNVKIESDFYSFHLESKVSSEGIKISNQLEINLPADASHETKEKLVTSINQEFLKHQLLLKKLE